MTKERLAIIHCHLINIYRGIPSEINWVFIYMDYISSTISFDQIDDLFQLPSSSLPYQERRMDVLDEILFAASPPNWSQILAGDDLLGGPAPPAELLPVAAPPSGGAVEQKIAGESGKKRKIVHRDVERQRRQEMASLYGSLRSRLPTELLKGKRSISDHIHQAVGYIRILQNKIQVLNDKRDELKRVSDPNHTCDPQTNKEEHPRITCRPLDMVTIESCIEGVEIIVSTDSRQGVALSKALNFLVQEGINVISCTSTRVKERLIHSIKSEVIGDNGIGSTNSISELKIKLMTQFC